MTFSQITANVTKLLNKHLTSYYTNRTCRAFVIHYCTYRRESNNLYEQNVHNYGNTERNSCFKQDYKHNETNVLDSTDYMMKEYKYDAEKLFPQPIVYLKEIYDKVDAELGTKCLSFTHRELKELKSHKYEYTINVTWPAERSFSSIASRKKVAAHNAALMCLHWLYTQRKIRGKMPLIYTYEDQQIMLQTQKFVDIDLELGLKDELKLLIDKFDNLKPEMETTQCVTESNENEELEDNASSDTQLSPGFIDMRNSLLLRNIEEKKDEDGSLPILEYREEILNSIQNNQIILIKGDTGCGKSTQIPQFIFDTYVRQKRGHECNIIVAEPRRVSAVSLACRVAQERNEELGDVVGYHVRFNKVVPEMPGSILYCTTGMLLRTLGQNVKLEGVSHLIVDEAHERSVHIDILLKLFKELLKNHSHIKLIIMSATVNAGLFQKYLSCPVIDIPGKTYPVKMHFMEDIDLFKTDLSNRCDLMHRSDAVDFEILFDKVVNLIQWIIKNKPPGAILCFLPGWQEIKQVHTLLEQTELDNLLILFLHSKISNNKQKKVFVPTPFYVTKVVLATDIAETGITIPDVSYVIDTAVKKDLVFDEDAYSSRICLRRISRSSISQRKGRAGRVKAGESYHLITQKDYNELDLHSAPEIFKIPLESSIITSKIFSNETINDFFGSMIESPSKKVLNRAVENLKNLCILDNDENLTSLGKRVSCFALDPKLSKAIVLSSIFQCLNPIMSIVTAFPIANSYISLEDSCPRRVFRDQKLAFHKTSDHIAIVTCDENNNESLFDASSNNSSIEKLYNIHMECLLSSRRMLPLDMEAANMYANNNELVRAILFASTNNLIKRNMGAYKRGHFRRTANMLRAENNETVALRSESVNYNRKEWPSDILTYIHKVNIDGVSFVSETSIISPLSVLLFSRGKVTCQEIPDKLVKGRDGQILINIENIENVQFCCTTENANLLLTFRNIMWNIVDFIMEYEGTNTHQDTLELVESYKESLMALLSKMLKQASHNIDNIDDPNNN